MKTIDRGEKTIQFTFLLVFFTSTLLIFFSLIFPVSALLNGTETLITTDIYKTLIFRQQFMETGLHGQHRISMMIRFRNE